MHALSIPAVRRADVAAQAWRERLVVCGLVVTGLVTLFVSLGSFRALGSHEVLAVVPAETMLRTGDWIVPDYGGIPRLKKPPLAYWLIAASGAIFGGLTEFTSRLPAAVSAALLALLVGRWAARWHGRPIGYAAALVQLTSVWVVMYGRKAEIDMALCLATTAATYLIADQPEGERGRRSFWRWAAVYLLLAAGWLCKFHYAAVMVLLPAFAHALIERRWGRLKSLLNPIGLSLLAAAVIVWPWLVAQRLPGAWDVWQRETLGRAMGELGHHRPIYYYLPKLAWMAVPWTPLAVVAAPESWRRAWSGRNPRERFLWVWIGVQLAVISLMPNKHTHYLMAMLPAVSLLAARGLWLTAAGFIDGRRRLSSRAANGWCAASVLGGSAVTLVVTLCWPGQWLSAVAFGSVFAVVGAIGFRRLAKGQVFEAAAATWFNLLACSLIALFWILPGRDPRAGLVDAAASLRRHAGPDATVCVYRMDRIGLIHYLGHPSFRRETEPGLLAAATPGRPLDVIGYTDYLDELAAHGELKWVRTWHRSGTRDFPEAADVSHVVFTPRMRNDESR
jgi:4-amino-4-deoxy-L-arabinose transferase-like glycosyltransferase